MQAPPMPDMIFTPSAPMGMPLPMMPNFVPSMMPQPQMPEVKPESMDQAMAKMAAKFEQEKLKK